MSAAYQDISYTETNNGTKTDLAEGAAATAFDYEVTTKTYYAYKPKLDFGIQGYATLYPISRSNTGITTRFVGGDVHLGPSFVMSRWKLSLFMGAYFQGMYVTSKAFGYNNVTGPEFYPVLSRPLANNGAISVYMKYTPVVQDADFKLMSWANRDFALGGAYAFPTQHYTADGYANTKPLALFADFSTLNLTMNNISGSSRIVTGGISVGF